MGGVPLASTYTRTIGSIDFDDAVGRCNAARAEGRRAHLVHDAAAAISPSRVDALQAEAAAAVAEEDARRLGATATAEQAASTARPGDVSSLAASASLQALAATLAAEPRLGIRGEMVKQLFSSGSLEGPFPGSKSANGLLNAERFYAVARPYGGAPPVWNPSQFSASGYRLKQ
jgi:hypothetical protein